MGPLFEFQLKNSEIGVLQNRWGSCVKERARTDKRPDECDGRARGICLFAPRLRSSFTLKPHEIHTVPI